VEVKRRRDRNADATHIWVFEREERRRNEVN